VRESVILSGTDVQEKIMDLLTEALASV